ncbi:hypothetical protein NOF55_02540 [Rhizobiaceae bacterium BDR2-2]|uniref:40-residue YVTN family beta-propeller repeat-containing protein n=1 Tax=Ectorhizobium quercum TaxID=2965071 RepID=A0AAE3MW47_9HYPH|nr:hypothetical protein [Ectorhizobium quercum]MCX8995974.1 hypothetical protein [Ectorhizobium quercum]
MKTVAYRLMLLTTILASGYSYANAQSVFSTAPEPEFQGSVSASSAERGQPIYAGSEITLSGDRFAPGQEVTIWRGATQLTTEPLKADGEGKFRWSATIPDDAAVGQHYLVVNAENPAASSVFKVKVSPKVDLFGDDKFVLTGSKLVRGLYQAAYSDKNDALFVTAAVGRPPVKESALVKIDPATLEISAQISPEAAPAPERGAGPAGGPGAGQEGPREGGVFAVYGIGLDDSKDTVWVTNTRQNTIAVYKQSDLSLVKQFEPSAISHPRDVVVDEARGHAYVSAARTNVVAVVDTNTLEIVKNIEIRSGKRGREQFGAASLAIDEAAGKLVTVSLTTNELAIIDLETQNVEKVIPVKGALSAIGVAYDHDSKRAFVASQGSDNLAIVDTDSGETLHTVPVGAGALSVTFDPVNHLAFVSNRGAGTVTVVSPDGEIVANLDGGSNPNHVIADGKGNVYAINKSRGEDDPTGDRISKIEPKS